MPTEDERSAIPGVLASIANALGIRLEIPDVLPGRSATFATVSDLSGVCPLCAAERASGRGDWTYDLAELPRGGSSIRLRDGHYVCSNVGCPAMRTGSAGLAPEAWVTRLSGGEPLWERWRAQWEVEMGKATNVVRLDGSAVEVDLDGEPIAPTKPRYPIPQRLSLADILDPPREVFIFGKMIPLGKSSVIFGPTGGGKSTFLAQLACSFASGQESIWGLPLLEGGGPVLVYTAEDTLDDWKRKVGAFTRAGVIDPKVALERLWIMDQSEGLARLHKVLDKRRGDERSREICPTDEQEWIISCACEMGAKLIIIETASRLVDDEDNPSFSALQSALGRIARRTGAAVIVSHHATKAASRGNDSAIESARGGGALIANARNALSLFHADLVPADLKDFDPECVLTLSHGKPTSSTKKQENMTLVLCDPGGDLGGVLCLPQNAASTTETARSNGERAGRLQEKENRVMRRLWKVVDEFYQAKQEITANGLKPCAHDIGVGKNKIDEWVEKATSRGIIKREPRAGRGYILLPGWNPSGGNSPGTDPDASDLE